MRLSIGTRLRDAARWLLLACLLAAPWAQAAVAQAAAAQAEFSLYVFRAGSPVAGTQLYVDGQKQSVTDAEGLATARAAPGERTLELKDATGAVLYTHRVAVDDGDYVQLIVTLEPQGTASADVEGGQAGEEVVTVAADVVPGTLRGRIVSVEDGKPVANARVFVSGSTQSVRTDADGRYTLELPPGIYALSVVHPRYTTRSVADLAVASEQVAEADVELTPSGLELAEFVVSAPHIEGSVAGVLAELRKSSDVSEVIGADQISKAGDSDAAEALQRVTGLTIEDGKYVVVRGQPSRYTATTWNGAPLPSPDPVKQVAPLDLFPTGVLSSINVQKSYSADKIGAFGAGLVTLNSRAVPDAPFAQISLSTGYNTQATGQQGFDYQGGSTDWLGVDDGTRALPGPIAAASAGGNLDRFTQAERDELGKSFDNIYRLSETTLPPNSGLSLAGGTNFSFGEAKFGVLGSLAWSNAYKNTEEVNNDYRLAGGGELAKRRAYDITRTDLEAQLGALFVLSGEWRGQALTSNTFFVRNTYKRSQFSDGFDRSSDDRIERLYLLDFNQREMLVQQFVGRHDLKYLQIDWVGQTATGDRSAPDRREYSYVLVGDQYIFGSEFAAKRQFNTTSDQTDSFDLGITVPILKGDDLEDRFALKVQTGFSYLSTERSSDTQRYRFEPNGSADLTPQNPDEILAPENIGVTVNFFDDTLGNDDYSGTSEVTGFYAQVDTTLWHRLRLLAGARQETATYSVQTFSDTLDLAPILGGFEDDNLLPAASATWFMTDTMQLRAAYGTSVSRPLLIELSNTLFFDPDNNLQFVGNPNLQAAEITSYDLRWEWYPSTAETLSVGVFAKDYANPIEQQFQPLGGGGEQITFVNGDSATVQGVELGGRSELDWATGWAGDWNRWLAWLEKSYVQANLSLITSEVTLAQTGVATNTQRPLQGQADHVVNLQFGFNGEHIDWTVSFNRVGERLQTAAINGVPDAYEVPFNSLDAAWSWAFMGGFKLKLSGDNLLDSSRRYFQGSDLERRLTPGSTFGASIGYTF